MKTTQTREYPYTIYDIEVYNNYCLVVANHVESEDYIRIDTRMDPKEQMKAFLELDGRILCGYNSNHYDSVIIEMWMSLLFDGKSNPEIEKILKAASNMIIEENAWRWKVFREFGVEHGEYFNHLDLADGYLKIGTLKEVGIRLQHDVLEHTPVDFMKDIVEEDIPNIIFYCDNDVAITKKLFIRKFNEVEAKQVLVDTYNLELSEFGRTNRQIVEDILCGDSQSKGSKFCDYKIPTFRETGESLKLSFNHEPLQNLLQTYKSNVIADGTSFKEVIELDGLEYEFGLGGIHASLNQYVKPDNKILVDIDVASYYPYLMRNFGFLPPSIKEPDDFFDMIEGRIENKRLAGVYAEQGDEAKAKYYKDLAWAQKIVINTVYGASKLKISKLYDVQTAYSITITGQLLLAKLAEMLTEGGYRVIYANTDGLMIEADLDQQGYLKVCQEWMDLTQLTLEFNDVHRLFLRDVNNYIIETSPVGSSSRNLKSVGFFNLKALNKNEAHQKIVKDAIVEYLFNGTSIETTINQANNLQDFVMYQKYSSQYHPIVIEDKRTGKQEHHNRVVRYVYSKERNVLKGLKGDSWTHRAEDITSLHDLRDFDISVVEKSRYIQDAYTELISLLGENVSFDSNEALETLKQQAEASGIKAEHLTPGIGKNRLPNNYQGDPWKDPRHNSLQLTTGPSSNLLAIDVDEPTHPKSIEFTKMLVTTGLENYCLTYSSKFTKEDILNNKARYKIILKYDSSKKIPKRKANKHIEVFYNDQPVAILGDRGDGYRYVLEGTIPTVSFDVNDYLESSIKFEYLELKKQML